jgi:hypothetical protein
VVVTDSGGVQEEAPTFGLPVLITRDTTERPEVIEAGFGQLVGSDTAAIVRGVRALTQSDRPQRVPGQNPFGRGDSAVQIAERLAGVDQSEQALPMAGHEAWGEGNGKFCNACGRRFGSIAKKRVGMASLAPDRDGYRCDRRSLGFLGLFAAWRRFVPQRGWPRHARPYFRVRPL